MRRPVMLIGSVTVVICVALLAVKYIRWNQEVQILNEMTGMVALQLERRSVDPWNSAIAELSSGANSGSSSEVALKLHQLEKLRRAGPQVRTIRSTGKEFDAEVRFNWFLGGVHHLQVTDLEF